MRSANLFVQRWRNRGDEISDTSIFWTELLRDVLDISSPTQFIDFQKKVQLDNIGRIDAYIPSSRTIIEQKSQSIDLTKPYMQSDGSLLTPFAQASRYNNALPYDERARWIVTCNFREFRIHDMQHPKDDPVIIELPDLIHDWKRLEFLVNKNALPPREIPPEETLSIKAGKLVRKLYEALEKSYLDDGIKIAASHKESMNVFCVRLVFLLYAEDAGILEKSQFLKYLKPRILTARDALLQLFKVLSQDKDERDIYLDDDLRAFPFVNGGLFDGSEIQPPRMNPVISNIIIQDMSERFDWTGINPPIFGALFESTLNDQTRQEGGMHYTTIENIHKVIGPLFLDDLTRELDELLELPPSRERTDMLRHFQHKLTTIRIFDPACGSGNFLTESYMSLCRLEQRVTRELGELPLAQVSISQFYGIEINDFAVKVARTALWIAESQMWNSMKSAGEFLPLKSEAHIVEGDALALDWREVISSDTENLYIVGNPPYMGFSDQTNEQKKLIRKLCGSGKIDYVAGWYSKAAEFMKGTRVRAAFLTTNSVTQGEQVGYIFKPLRERYGIHVDFAHTTFMWSNELKDNPAHVHCVVVGFNAIAEEEGPERVKRIFTGDECREVGHINFYLFEGADVFAESRTKPVSADAPRMRTGNMPADGGHLIIEAEDYEEFIRRQPGAKKFIKRYVMGDDFINNVTRYCLWLVDSTAQERHDMKHLRKRLKLCKEFRLASKREATRKAADTPYLFAEIRQPENDYLAIPKTSSENREYIPMGWLDKSIIPGDGLRIIPSATLYHFGVLTSRVHMAWMRAVCGRLEMRYRYSNTVVYNTFVWPRASEGQRAVIEGTARRILEARGAHEGESFAALYDDVSMPGDLRRAHSENDAAVCEAYGWDAGISEEEIVGKLFVLYADALKAVKG